MSEIISTQFKDKVVLVTGAASGIGKAAALEYARRGARVIGVDMNKVGGMELETEVQQSGLDIRFRLADISQEKEVDELISAIVTDYGRLDVAFNNAGISGVHAPIVHAEKKRLGSHHCG